MPKVRFVNELVTVEVPVGSSLRDAAIHCGVEIYRGMWTHINCRGNGICGRCRVWILTTGSTPTLREKAHRVRGSQRLACQVRITSDLEVRTKPLGPATVQVARVDQAPAYLQEAEQRLVSAREEAKKEAEKKAREAAKKAEEARKAEEAKKAAEAATAATAPVEAAAPPAAPGEAKPG